MSTSLHGTDVLGGLVTVGAGIPGDPRPFGFQGFNPYLETSPIYDYPPDDEYFVPKPGGGFQKVILGAGEMIPGGWWYTGSYRGPWWGGNGPFMDVDDFVDPMDRIDPHERAAIMGILHGTDILGADPAGLTNIQTSQARMNALKPVTLNVARALLSSGQEVIDKAIETSKQPWYRADLPGESQRNNVLWKLRWHADQLRAQHGDPNTVLYASADDLKKWVMQAFIEHNAALTGAQDAAWLEIQLRLMWDKVATALAEIPAQVRGALMSVASGTVEAVTGLPIWAWVLIALGGTALLGFLVLKLLGAAANTKAGAAAAHVAARRFL